MYPGWLELPLARTNFNGPKPVHSVRAIEVLLYVKIIVSTCLGKFIRMKRNLMKKSVLLAKYTPQKACACIIDLVNEQIKIYNQT